MHNSVILICIGLLWVDLAVGQEYNISRAWSSSFYRNGSGQYGQEESGDNLIERLKEFRGLQGEPGAKGDAGPKGDRGIQGQKGDKGDRGSAGTNGVKGDRGSPGNAVKGERGVTGPAGPIGLHGIDGIPGLQGIPGKVGDRGEPGPQGPPGVITKEFSTTFSDGNKGDKGEPGRDGENGSNGIPGIPGPPGAPGRSGIPGYPGLIGAPGLPGVPGMNIQSDDPDFRNTLVKSCAEIFQMSPNHISGKYTIDPNGGRGDDAIEAYCDFGEISKTCFDVPVPEEMHPFATVLQSHNVWLSTLVNSTWMTHRYNKFRHQIPSLQLLFLRASQSLTYHCVDAVQSIDLTLIGWNEAVVRSDPKHRLHYESAYEGCKKPSRVNERTEMFIETGNPFILPFIDVGLNVEHSDQTDSMGNHQFMLELGMLCFYDRVEISVPM